MHHWPEKYSVFISSLLFCENAAVERSTCLVLERDPEMWPPHLEADLQRGILCHFVAESWGPRPIF